MIQQTTFYLSAKRRGCHLVTREVLEHLPKPLPQTGLLHLFVQHTSCALSINENADPDVRSDLNQIMNHLVKENEPYYDHTMEGLDDMPAHAKCVPTDKVRQASNWSSLYLFVLFRPSTGWMTLTYVREGYSVY